ncbi:PREDICTED: ribonuclease 2-like isoform X6 [Nicotiana attenuata]|uniref:ribonuclease 2-like isoform X6 n=1 Tax=Nicotiana attenuata TaxID=49451 RepID=UPI0009052EA0|nr:PREDICTED: ribonuclease 2-like isoform X6 [Nicotiana attenuata]XP_019259564.1 PREDICTED: ribonuclease 2-like isoform X6 [Nicotiana attenuata]
MATPPIKVILYMQLLSLFIVAFSVIRINCSWDAEEGLLRKRSGVHQRQFDYFKLSLLWPATACRNTTRCCSSNACCRSNSPSEFTIHGLWADYNDGTWPACCSGPQFDKKEISTLLKPLRKYWPSFSCEAVSNCHHGKGTFWAHEWEKHGTCSYPVVHDEYEYFLTTLNVYFKYNVTGVLFEAGYVPSNSEKYPLGGIISAIQNAFHATPELICSGDDVEELRICFYKDFQVTNKWLGSVSSFVLQCTYY